MPQPIDPNSEIGRLTAAERVQQLADRLSMAAQMRHSNEMQEERVDLETAVQHTQAQSEQVETEKKRRNPFIGRKKKKEGQQQDAGDVSKVFTFYGAHEQTELVTQEETHRLDVVVTDEGVIEE